MALAPGHLDEAMAEAVTESVAEPMRQLMQRVEIVDVCKTLLAQTAAVRRVENLVTGEKRREQ